MILLNQFYRDIRFCNTKKNYHLPTLYYSRKSKRKEISNHLRIIGLYANMEKMENMPELLQNESIVFSINELVDRIEDTWVNVFLTNFRLILADIDEEEEAKIYNLNNIITLNGTPNITYNIEGKEHLIDIYFTNGQVQLTFNKRQSVYTKDFLDKLTYYAFGRSIEILPIGYSASGDNDNKGVLGKFGLFKKK